MALVYKVHIQGGSDNTALFPHNHPYISSCKLQLNKFLLQLVLRDGYVGVVLCSPCHLVCVPYTGFISANFREFREWEPIREICRRYYTIGHTQ